MLSIPSTPFRETSGTGPRRVATLLAAGCVALGVTFAAEPAAAGHEFKAAFKEEFGRILAHHVAAVAPAILLAPGHHAFAVRHHRPRHHRRWNYSHRWGHHRDYDLHRGHHYRDRHHRSHHDRHSYDRRHGRDRKHADRGRRGGRRRH